ncbi:hypothetical protein [Methanohalophilus mahii]|uniref:Uncharacterized protein n=1 Tax=Methanohalophilus mahii (strain ATCC 35705 / DSM 5219 / SLP) TaxID=547558 RepID=D5E9Z4_METMS|nr:hypothetical protein [Methanohalophilus mahii]ADE35995.1 hypothetical protein Mmah_0465 [Methanohalophilus mahii DSM 5219]
MEHQLVTFKKTFEDLNNLGNNSLFDFDGEKIVLLNNRTKLFFIETLGLHDPAINFCSLGLTQIPKVALEENIKNSFEEIMHKNFVFVHKPGRTAINRFVEGLEDTKICIQADIPSNYVHFPNKYIISTEKLGTLVSMLYFREKGYIVQNPLGTYGKEGNDRPGIDDVVAWKSPTLDELRKFRFIDKGCHISELACLRWLDRVPEPSTHLDSPVNNELILVEVKSSKRYGLSNSPSRGVDQLLRAKKEKVAKKLFISFPTVDSDHDEVFAKIKKRMDEGPVAGGIFFDDKGLHIHDSESFHDENVTTEIDKYESELKLVLLNNFYFNEILEMIGELDVDTDNKGLEEVLDSFNAKIENDVSTNYLLEKLNKLIG